MTRIITTSVAGAGKTPDPSRSFYGTTVSESVLDSSLTAMVKTSTRAWSQYVDIDYIPVSDSGADDVAGANGDWHLRFMVAPTTLSAFASANDFGVVLGQDAVVFFNSNAVLPTYNVTSVPDLFQHIVMHEIGHVLGLAHTGNVGDIMYSGPGNNSTVITPASSEVAATQARFGAAQGRTAKLQQGGLIGDIWSLYRGIYGSNPDTASLKFWNNAILDGAQTREALSIALAASTGGSDAAFVSNLYTGALGRAGDPSEISYWAGQIPLVGRAQVARSIAFSAEAASYRYGQMYLGLWYE